MHILTANTNPETGVAYGYVAASYLDSDLVHSLMWEKGEDETRKNAEYETAMEVLRTVVSDKEYQSITSPEPCDMEQVIQLLRDYDMFFEYERAVEDMEISEPLIHGEYEGVHYMTSWLGGALHFFITQSPHITKNAHKASPCVPNAGILHHPDENDFGDVEAYTVPNDWWSEFHNSNILWG